MKIAPQLSLTVPRLRILQCAENISSALKRRVNVCQEPSVNEVLGFLVTEFVRDFGGEDTTPIQLSFHRGLLDHI
jgi:hypothetical protein